MDDYKSGIEHLENPINFNILANTPLHHYFYLHFTLKKKNNNKKKKEEVGYQRDEL